MQMAIIAKTWHKKRQPVKVAYCILVELKSILEF